MTEYRQLDFFNQLEVKFPLKELYQLIRYVFSTFLFCAGSKFIPLTSRS